MGLFKCLFSCLCGKAKTIEIPASGEAKLNIVGESRYRDALEAICGGASEAGHVKKVKAKLITEDHAERGFAVRVEIEGKPVGYLDRQDIDPYRAWLAKGGYKESAVGACDAVIIGGKKSAGEKASYNVKLDVTL